MRWLMDELASRCIAESLRLQEDEHDLFQRLCNAESVIQRAWWSAAPGAKEEPDAQEKEKIRQARRTLWVRHYPARALMEGVPSEHPAAIDKSHLHSAIVDYLDRPYLCHSTLDWIFLDMTISSEITAFGEQLKEGVFGSTADEIDPRVKMLQLWIGMCGV